MNKHSVIENQQMNNNANSCIWNFFTAIGLSETFRACGFFKQTGLSVIEVFKTIFSLVFKHKNWWRTCTDEEHPVKCEKDVVYRFLNHMFYRWEDLLLQIAIKLIHYYKGLTNSKRTCALVFDDTFFDRMRSKKVELVSWIFDHVDMKNKKGFTALTGGWTDGFSFVPFIFQLVCSSKPKNILKEALPVKKDSVAENRRNNAKKKKTALLIEMVKKAIAVKLPFSFVLFDSWFAFPVIFIQLRLLKKHAIAMLKDHAKIFYTYRGQSYRLSRLYAKIKKHLKQDRDTYAIIASIAGLNTTIKVKIVFIRDKRAKRNWVALLSTNIVTDEQKIIQIYGMRWNIEVFFKMSKTYLRFAKEFQGRSFDMLVAHTTIVYLRYIMFTYYARLNTDEKSFGDLFYDCCAEVKTISFIEALALILELLKQFLMDKLTIAEEVIETLAADFFSTLPKNIFQKLPFKNCES